MIVIIICLMLVQVLATPASAQSIRGNPLKEGALPEKQLHVLDTGAVVPNLTESAYMRLQGRLINAVPLSDNLALWHGFDFKAYGNEGFTEPVFRFQQLVAVQTEKWSFFGIWRNFSNRSFEEYDDVPWALFARSNFFHRGKHSLGVTFAFLSSVGFYRDNPGPLVVPSYVYSSERLYMELGPRSMVWWRWSDRGRLLVNYTVPNRVFVKNILFVRFLFLSTSYRYHYQKLKYYGDIDDTDYIISEHYLRQDIGIPLPPGILLYFRGEYRFSGYVYRAEKATEVIRGTYDEKRYSPGELYLGGGVVFIFNRFFTKRKGGTL